MTLKICRFSKSLEKIIPFYVQSYEEKQDLNIQSIMVMMKHSF